MSKENLIHIPVLSTSLSMKVEKAGEEFWVWWSWRVQDMITSEQLTNSCVIFFPPCPAIQLGFPWSIIFTRDGHCPAPPSTGPAETCRTDTNSDLPRHFWSTADPSCLLIYLASPSIILSHTIPSTTSSWPLNTASCSKMVIPKWASSSYQRLSH